MLAREKLRWQIPNAAQRRGHAVLAREHKWRLFASGRGLKFADFHEQVCVPPHWIHQVGGESCVETH